MVTNTTASLSISRRALNSSPFLSIRRYRHRRETSIKERLNGASLHLRSRLSKKRDVSEVSQRAAAVGVFYVPTTTSTNDDVGCQLKIRINRSSAGFFVRNRRIITLRIRVSFRCNFFPTLLSPPPLPLCSRAQALIYRCGNSSCSFLVFSSNKAIHCLSRAAFIRPHK